MSSIKPLRLAFCHWARYFQSPHSPIRKGKTPSNLISQGGPVPEAPAPGRLGAKHYLGSPCLVLTLLRIALQPSHLEETVTGRRPGVGGWPRWPFGGSKLGRAGPHRGPRPAALLPSPSLNPTSSPAPFITLATLHHRQQGDQPLATLHPTEPLQSAPTSSRWAPVASSPELSPRSPGPPERSSPALSA